MTIVRNAKQNRNPNIFKHKVHCISSANDARQAVKNMVAPPANYSFSRVFFMISLSAPEQRIKNFCNKLGLRLLF